MRQFFGVVCLYQKYHCILCCGAIMVVIATLSRLPPQSCRRRATCERALVSVRVNRWSESRSPATTTRLLYPLKNFNGYRYPILEYPFKFQ